METTGEEQSTEPTFRFSIRLLLWLITIIAVGLGIFGTVRTLIWVPIATAPILNSLFLRRKTTIAEWFIFLGIGLILCSFIKTPPPRSVLIPTTPAPPEFISSIYTVESYYRIDSIGSNILKNGQFPNNLYDESDKPLHSWRTLLSPYVRNEHNDDEIDFSKAWNDPETNLPLFKDGEHHLFVGSGKQCPLDTRLNSTFFAVVDEEAAWKPKQESNVSDIKDDPANTIFLIEVINSKHPWYEPYDLTIEEAVDLLTEPDNYQHTYDIDDCKTGFFSSGITRVAYYPPFVYTADGYPPKQFKRFPSRELARAALTANGGEEIDLSSKELQAEIKFRKVNIYHWDKILGTLAFLALAIYPLWQNQSLPTTSPANLSGGE